MCVRLLALVSSLVFVASALGAADELAEGFVCTDAAPENSVTFQIDPLRDGNAFGVTLAPQYFDPRRVPEADSTRDAALIYVDLRTFTPWPDGARRHPDQEGYARVLVSEFVPPDQLADGQARLALRIPFNAEGPVLQTVPDLHGLNRFEGTGEYAAATGSADVLQRDVFVPSSEDDTPTVLVCDRAFEGLFPTCRQYIDVENGDLLVTFARSFLPEWREISARADAFWRCATEF